MFRSHISIGRLASSYGLILILFGLILSLAHPIIAIPRCSIAGFTPARNYIVPRSGAVPVAADFNGDGHLDIVAAIPFGGGTSVLLNDGTGNFGAAANYLFGESQYDAVVADFNQDNKLDIVVSNYWSNTVSVLLGRGDGTFNPAITSPSGGTRPQRMVISDFNHDDYLDVAVSNNPLDGPGSNIAILYGNGTGNFTLATTFSHCSFMRGADFNRDGNMDLLGVTTSPLSLYLGNSQGGFSAPIAIGTDLPASVPSFAIDDFNHDGNPDVAALYGSGLRHVAILRGNGDGTFTTLYLYQMGVQNGAHLATGDVNADGEVDIVGTNPDNTMGQGFVLFGTGTGDFGGRVNYNVNGTSPSQLAVADFNGDARADIVTDMNVAAISVVLNTCLNPTPRYDFDGDGKADISVYRPSSGMWYAFASTTNSLRSQSWGISTDMPVAADYDGDRKTDYAVYRPAEGMWYILKSSDSSFLAQPFGLSTDVAVIAGSLAP